MTGAKRGAVGFAPTKLEIHRRTGDVVGGDGAAGDRLFEERRVVVADDLTGSNRAAAGAQRGHSAGKTERPERSGVCAGDREIGGVAGMQRDRAGREMLEAMDVPVIV